MSEALLGAAQCDGEIVAPDVVLTERVITEGEAVTVEPRDRVEGRLAAVLQDAALVRRVLPQRQTDVGEDDHGHQHGQADHRESVAEEPGDDQLPLRLRLDRELAIGGDGVRLGAVSDDIISSAMSAELPSPVMGGSIPLSSTVICESSDPGRRT